MVLIDTSAWIEYLRNTNSPTHLAAASAVHDGIAVATDAIVLEVLSGSSASAVERIARLLGNQRFAPQEPYLDARAAADIYHVCRSQGATPRSTVDCLIAAVAIREDIPVVHCDRDFDVIARHTDLRVVRR